MPYCGKQFAYDAKAMRIGKPIERSEKGGVLPAKMPKPRKTKLRYALLAAVPAAVVVGLALKRKDKVGRQEPQWSEPSHEADRTVEDNNWPAPDE